jgi:hypothetical protein
LIDGKLFGVDAERRRDEVLPLLDIALDADELGERFDSDRRVHFVISA